MSCTPREDPRDLPRPRVPLAPRCVAPRPREAERPRAPPLVDFAAGPAWSSAAAACGGSSSASAGPPPGPAAPSKASAAPAPSPSPPAPESSVPPVHRRTRPSALSRWRSTGRAAASTACAVHCILGWARPASTVLSRSGEAATAPTVRTLPSRSQNTTVHGPMSPPLSPFRAAMPDYGGK